jgi:hypothetical protein
VAEDKQRTQAQQSGQSGVFGMRGMDRKQINGAWKAEISVCGKPTEERDAGVCMKTWGRGRELWVEGI